MKFSPQKTIKLLIVILLLLFVAVNLYCETIGVPAMIRNAIQAKFAENGIAIHAENIRGGVVGGIKFDNLTIQDGERAGVHMLDARQISIQPNLLELIKGKFVPRRVKVKSATIYFPPSMNDHKSPPRPMLESVDGLFTWGKHSLTIRKFQAQFAGAQITLDGAIRNLPAMLPNSTAPESPVKTLSWDLLLAEIPESYSHYLPEIRDFASRQNFIPQETFATASFDIDIAAPEAITADAFFQLNEVMITNLPIRTLKGRLDIRDSVLKVPKISLHAGFDSSIQGAFEIDLNSRLIRGRFQGNADPRLAYRFIDRAMPRWLAETRMPTPPWFELNLAPSPLNPLDWEVTADIKAYNVIYRKKHVQSATGQLQRQPGIVKLSNGRVEFDRFGREYLKADLDLSEGEEPRISGIIEGAAAPATITAMLASPPRALSQLVSDIHIGGMLPAIKITLNESGFTVDTANLDIAIKADEFRLRDLAIAGLKIPLQIKDQKVFSQPEIRLESDGDTTAQKVTGQAIFDLLKKTVTAEIYAQAYPDRLVKNLHLPDHDAFNRLSFLGQPANINFTLRESPLFSPTEWNAAFEINASDITYESLEFQSADIIGKMDRQQIQITSAHGISPDFELIQVDNMTISMTRPEVTLSGTCKAHPSAILPLIHREPSRDFYQKIWTHFEWADDMPHIRLDNLHFRQSPSGKQKLDIDLHAKGENFSYRGIDIDSFATDLKVRLPKEVSLENMRAIAGESDAEANITFPLAGTPMLLFEVDGNFNPFDIFSAFSPEAKETLSPFSVSESTSTSLKGSSQLRGDPKLRMEARLKGDQLNYYMLRFDDFEAEFQIIEHEIKWHIPKANFNDGTAVINGFYNRFFGNGHLAVDVKNAALAGIVSQLHGDQFDKDFGIISCRAIVDLQRQSEDGPIRMQGEGSIDIKEGELWDAPILRQLGQTLGISALGRISELETEVKFSGTRAIIPEFNTDGTILALSGNGHYDWADSSLNFRVYGQALKPTSLVPLVLKPLSWFFEAELSGTPEDHKWRLLGPIRRLFPGSGD